MVPRLAWTSCGNAPLAISPTRRCTQPAIRGKISRRSAPAASKLWSQSVARLNCEQELRKGSAEPRVLRANVMASRPTPANTVIPENGLGVPEVLDEDRSRWLPAATLERRLLSVRVLSLRGEFQLWLRNRATLYDVDNADLAPGLSTVEPKC